MVDQARQCNRKRQDFGRDDGLCDQHGVLGDRRAVTRYRLAEEEPWQESTKDEDRIVVAGELIVDRVSHNNAEHETVTSELYDWMDDGPEEAADGSHVATLQVTNDEVLKDVPIGSQSGKHLAIR